MDKLIVKELAVRNIIGVDSWERSKRQPLIIDLVAFTDVGPSGMHDLLSESISYSAISKTAQEYSESTAFKSLEALAAGIALTCLTTYPLEQVSVAVRKPRALLHAASAGVEITRSRADVPSLSRLVTPVAADAASAAAALAARPALSATSMAAAAAAAAEPQPPREDVISINDLALNCIIGVNAWEREERQKVLVNLRLHVQLENSMLVADHVPKMHNYRTITRMVSRLVEDSSFKTVEALVMRIAALLIQTCFVPKVTVRVEKPSALVFAASAGVEITRTRESLLADMGAGSRAASPGVGEPESAVSATPAAAPAGGIAADPLERTVAAASPATVFLAVGSNLGNRVANIEQAIARLTAAGVTIADTSFLYETSPMYVTDQPLFLNACLKVRTALAPHDLLALLKTIEADLGRELNNGVRYGPRPIDLDILFYNHLELNTETLVIPHPRIAEREFVLRPLCDIAPDMEHVGQFRTCRQQLALLKHRESLDPIWKVMPVRSGVWRVTDRTFIMGILNATPDSFSDGGSFSTADAAVARAAEMIAEGVDIIDVGGQSTRPHAVEVSEREETDRVVPVIQAIRKRFPDIPISIDTYRAAVAQAAVDAGADLINDISGGTRDPAMLAVMARTRKPVCLMHMRGDSHTMMELTDYGGDVIRGIRSSMASLVTHALAAGIFRWNVLVDPGIGFAKTLEQNYEILRKLPEIVKRGSVLDGFPTLVGPSRKGFIGKTIHEDDPKKRGWGTAAACSASVAGGATVVRVHDVKEMKDVVLVADRCFRS
ncbi:trifunctional dihydropteroate synthetase [Polyrhizophydium stewartii]|uniref:Trifunctional dihydropteroate synthetase n=1 Tax=Polyrhizophydium stewartii TaxID=2732419 RepID=A0ABR4MY54_9FUNG|nr:trifunctional dihydropteroate synthetase [Polyrhizophydium stewartii]